MADDDNNAIEIEAGRKGFSFRGPIWALGILLGMAGGGTALWNAADPGAIATLFSSAPADVVGDLPTPRLQTAERRLDDVERRMALIEVQLRDLAPRVEHPTMAESTRLRLERVESDVKGVQGDIDRIDGDVRDLRRHR